MLINFYSKYGKKLTLAFLLFFFLAIQSIALAQTGTIRGRVLDKTSSDGLTGANVIIKGTGLGAAADLDGNFIVRNVPAGTHVLVVSYIGYNPVSTSITVKAGETLEQDVLLEPTTLQGETVVITAQAQGQLGAINQQLSSNTIENVVAKDRIKELPDVNAAESIGRLPGVSIERSGGEANKISIRGLEPKYNTVTVNGVRVPATGGDDRSVDLSLISSNMLDGISVKKANTPDMDADALGGTVDLRLREAPEKMELNISAQGGYNQLQDSYGNYNITGSVSKRFFDNYLGVVANFNFDSYNRSADKFSGNYEQTGTGSKIVVRPTQAQLRDENIKRGRTGASVLLDFRIPNGKIAANSFFNNLHNDGLYRINNMDVSHNSHYYNLEDRVGNTSILTGALSGTQDFDWIEYDVTISRTSSRNYNPNDYTWGFSQESGAFDIAKVYPGMDPHLIPGLAHLETSADTFRTGLQQAFMYSTNRNENESALQLNIKMPFTLGTDINGYIKFGGKFRWLDRVNDETQYGRDNLQYGGNFNILKPAFFYLASAYPDYWDLGRDTTLAKEYSLLPITRFTGPESTPSFLNGEYNFGFIVNERLLQQFTEALQQTAANGNWLYYAMGSMGRDYAGLERYQAGYLMSEITLWNYVTVIPGFRYEKEYTRYNGQRFREVDQAGAQLPPRDFERLTNVRTGEFFLPMIHIIVDPFEWMKIRLARTETLTRPDYIQYAPITTIDRFSGYIRANNAGLKTSHSKNYDASISVFENYTGLITASGFYKTIDDLVFQAGYKLYKGNKVPLLPGLNVPNSWLDNNPTMDTYVNNPYPAVYKGFELDWQTRMWYLPSFLQGIVLNINYTRIFSDVDKQLYRVNVGSTGIPPKPTYAFVDTFRTARMPYQPAHILNFTFGYDIGGFSARISYLYQTDKTTYIGTDAPLDQTTGTYARWDISVLQKLEWGLQVFANFNNINKRADRTFRGNVETNASYTEYYGFTMDLGFRYSL